MRMVEGGIVDWLLRVVRKVDMMLLMSDVRGLFHSSHLGLGSLIGRFGGCREFLYEALGE